MSWLHRVLTLLAAGAVVASVLPILAEQWWVFELFTHFRVQYLAALAILFPVALICRRWLWSLMLIPFGALNVLPLIPYWPTSPETPVGPEHMKVMTANLGRRNTNYAPLIRLIERESPDLLLLLEFDTGWAGAVEPLEKIYPHQITVPRDNAYGVALLSRFPFDRERSFELLTTPAVDARIDVSGNLIRVLGVHLRPPTTSEQARERNAQLNELVTLVQPRQEPLLLMGDFNVTPFSPHFHDFVTETALRDTLLGRGLSFSWPAALPILGIPIDHCLVSREFLVIEHSRGQAFGSDHYPILATLGLGANE